MDYAQEALDAMKRSPRDQHMQIMKDFGEICFEKGWKKRESLG